MERSDEKMLDVGELLSFLRQHHPHQIASRARDQVVHQLPSHQIETVVSQKAG